MSETETAYIYIKEFKEKIYGLPEWADKFPSDYEAKKLLKELGGDKDRRGRWRVRLDTFKVWYHNTTTKSFAVEGGELIMMLSDKIVAQLQAFAHAHGGIRDMSQQKRPEQSRYYVRVYGEDGSDSTYSLKTSDETQAKNILAEVRTRFVRQVVSGLRYSSTADAIDEFLKEEFDYTKKLKEGSTRPVLAMSTYKAYATALYYFRDCCHAGTTTRIIPSTIQGIQPAHIRAYHKHLETDAPGRSESGGFQPGSRILHTGTSKRFLSWCVGEGYLAANPCDDEKIVARSRRNTGTRTIVTGYTLEQVRAILTELDRRVAKAAVKGKVQGWRIHRNIVTLMLYTGARVGDACNFMWGNVNFPDIGEPYVEFVAEKNGKLVRVPMTNELRDMFMSIRPDNPRPDQLCFPSPTNPEKPVSTSNVSRSLVEAAAVIGFQKKSPNHSLRHTCGELLMAAGVPPDQVAGMLGDTTETVVKYYTPARPVETANVLSAYAKAANTFADRGQETVNAVAK